MNNMMKQQDLCDLLYIKTIFIFLSCPFPIITHLLNQHLYPSVLRRLYCIIIFYLYKCRWRLSICLLFWLFQLVNSNWIMQTTWNLMKPYISSIFSNFINKSFWIDTNDYISYFIFRHNQFAIYFIFNMYQYKPPYVVLILSVMSWIDNMLRV